MDSASNHLAADRVTSDPSMHFIKLLVFFGDNTSAQKLVKIPPTFVQGLPLTYRALE